jgi:hypothetical protein
MRGTPRRGRYRPSTPTREVRSPVSEVPEADPPDHRGVPGAGPGPTSGDPDGRHRVLEPAGGLPVTATRLDPAPAVWDRERRVDL